MDLRSLKLSKVVVVPIGSMIPVLIPIKIICNDFRHFVRKNRHNVNESLNNSSFHSVHLLEGKWTICKIS